MVGVILYGPPAAGKDTVTKALTVCDGAFSLYERLKIGRGRTAGYRMASEEQVAELRESGAVVWENSRYGATYFIDKPSLRQALEAGFPVVHLGQAQAITAVKGATPSAAWLVIELWCPWDTAKNRIVARGTGDYDDRRRAFEATERLATPDLRIDTSRTSPMESAKAIIEALRAFHPAADPSQV